MASVEEKTLAKAFLHIDDVTDTWARVQKAERDLQHAIKTHDLAKARLYDFARITREGEDV
jgi:hypothetical protein